MAPLIAFGIVLVVTMIVLWLLHGYTVQLGNTEPADVWTLVLLAAASAAIAAGIVALTGSVFALVAGILS